MHASSKILVFTDIHIDVEPRTDAPNAEARLKAGIAHAMKHQGDADGVIITGDLTHRGDLASYETLKTLLEPLTLPVHLMIGNHDNRAAFLQVFPDTPIDENGFVQRVIDLPDARLVLLDTLFAPPYDYPASHAGALCPARLAWLQQALTDTPKPCILFMHHPAHETGFAGMDAIRLRDGEEFYDVLARAGNVSHVICGHVHRTISGTHRGVSYSMFKSFVGQMPMDLDATDTTTEIDEPPAYGILLIEQNGIVAHTEDFTA